MVTEGPLGEAAQLTAFRIGFNLAVPEFGFEGLPTEIPLGLLAAAHHLAMRTGRPSERNHSYPMPRRNVVLPLPDEVSRGRRSARALSNT